MGAKIGTAQRPVRSISFSITHIFTCHMTHGLCPSTCQRSTTNVSGLRRNRQRTFRDIGHKGKVDIFQGLLYVPNFQFSIKEHQPAIDRNVASDSQNLPPPINFEEFQKMIGFLCFLCFNFSISATESQKVQEPFEVQNLSFMLNVFFCQNTVICYLCPLTGSQQGSTPKTTSKTGGKKRKTNEKHTLV